MRLSVCLLMFAMALLFAAPTSADRDIVFSAQFYRRSNEYYTYLNGTRERTLDDVGRQHIYRINPDGSGLTRITHGKFDDFNPKWSPDGQKILFSRGLEYYSGTVRLFVMRPDGINTRMLATFRGHEIDGLEYQWSPDGRQIAVRYRDGDSSNAANHVFTIDSNTGKKLKSFNATNFSWSPDGRSIYLSKNSGDVIVKLADGKTIPVRHSVVRPIWISRYRVAGFKHMGEKDSLGFEPTLLRVVDLHNATTSDIKFIEQGNNDHPFGQGDYGLSWHFLYSDALLALQLNHGVSDGTHSITYIVNCNSGFWKQVIEGPTVAVSPDGWRLLVTTHEWIGPYKRGGRRCGPLEIVDAVTLKRRKITTNLVTVGRGDWRRKRRRTAKSLSFR